MTLGNMRANGVRSLDVCCWQCHHQAVLSADPWPDDMPVPSFGPRMVCTRCGIVGADARPNWREQPARLSGAGTDIRPAHGLHPVRHLRCRRPAELARATSAAERRWHRAMAMSRDQRRAQDWFE
jgi:hypothetical protein